MMKKIGLIAMLLLATACGKREGLKPAPGASMPPKSAMARTAPTADELLTPPAQARPERNIEQIRRSKERTEDPFDLPPPAK